MDTPSDMQAQRQRHVGNGLLGLPARMVRALVKWRRRRRLLQELLALDDHLLKDIGFRRDEVLKALHEGGTPKRVDWASEIPCKTDHGGGTRCPQSECLVAGRPCSM